MKCVIFLSLVAFAYAYPPIGYGVGVGSTFRIQEDGSTIIASPTGKQIILRKPVGVYNPEHIEAIVHGGVNLPIKRYQIDALTGLPISIQSPLEVYRYLKDAKNILSNILEEVLDQKIMNEVENNLNNIQNLDPVLYNVMNLWHKKQYLEGSVFNPVTPQQAMIFWKQQQDYQQSYPLQVQGIDMPYLHQQVPIQQLIYGNAPFGQYQQYYKTPLEQLQQLSYRQQYNTVASPWEVQLVLQLQQQMEILQQQIQYFYQQGHEVLALEKLQQLQQLQEQQESLQELIQQRYQSYQPQQSGNLWNFWTMSRQQPWSVRAPQQNVWQQKQYWNPLGQQQWSQWGRVLGYPHQQQVGGWGQQMFTQQQQPIVAY